MFQNKLREKKTTGNLNDEQSLAKMQKIALMGTSWFERNCKKQCPGNELEM